MDVRETLQRTAPGDERGEVVDAGDVEFDVDTDVLVAGGGGCGLVAALSVSEDPDLRVTILEKSPEVGGNTSLSTGMIPAPDTRMQCAAGIEDSVDLMAQDILEKNDYTADEARVRHLCSEATNLVHWLVDGIGVSLSLVDDFKYPKHSVHRMHAPPGRNGDTLVAELHDLLTSRSNVELLTDTPVRKLVAEDGAVVGAVAGARRSEAIAAERTILATDGFGGNRSMVSTYCDDAIGDALYFGADGNTGDGIRWGDELGGDLEHMTAYQGHATVASDTGSLSTYAVIMNGGILVNERGERFGDESSGYSAFAVDVLDQPGGVAYEIFDERIFERLQGEFDDFDEAVDRDTYRSADDVEALARSLGADPEATAATLRQYNEAVSAGEPDETGRTDGTHVLEPPFYGTKVTAALFHTQGGLAVDEHARVLREDGSIVDRLYAGGGAAAGISGDGAGGYLSGNGLTAALGYGRLAGIHARESLS
jgi:fumarate reductase flavoprotein subunit